MQNLILSPLLTTKLGAFVLAALQTILQLWASLNNFGKNTPELHHKKSNVLLVLKDIRNLQYRRTGRSETK